MTFLLRESICIPQAVKRHSFFPRQCEDLSALGHLLSPICRKPVSGHSMTEDVSKSDQDIFVRPLSNFTLLEIPIKGKGNKFMSFVLSLWAALQVPGPNASAPSHDNPRAVPAEVRDHLILYSQTQLVINRLHLIRNTEEQGLSVYRFALPAFPLSPRSHVLSLCESHYNTAIVKSVD